MQIEKREKSMDTKKLKQLVGESAKEDDLRYVDSYMHNHIGLFIPSVGFCQYAIKEGHTHPSYMIVIAFDEDSMHNSSKIKSDIIINEYEYVAMVLSPDIPHQETGEYFNHYYCIMIEKEYFESEYLKYESEIPVFRWKTFPICHDILKTLNQFAFEYGKKMKNSDITLDAQEVIITHWLIRSIIGENYDLRAISSDYCVARVQHYMEQHFGEKITLGKLAELCNVSVSVISRKFKNDVGMTPIEYLNKIRLEKAKKLLRRPERQIVDIALYCGFGSSAHFTEVFSRYNDITPSAYRKNYLS